MFSDSRGKFMRDEALDLGAPAQALHRALVSAPLIGFDTHKWSARVSDSGAKPAFMGVMATCFGSGTLIRTARGDVAVEALVVSDLAVTGSGAQRPIRWLGHRTIDCRKHSHPEHAVPICIAAHAFGENHPARDLFVSPGHAICVDVAGEVLIPAAVLVNGTTIFQVEVETVTYWHVELEEHDVILAENLPAESYLEMGNRGFFTESSTVILDASPDAPARTHADFLPAVPC